MGQQRRSSTGRGRVQKGRVNVGSEQFAKFAAIMVSFTVCVSIIVGFGVTNPVLAVVLGVASGALYGPVHWLLTRGWRER